jgi:UDP-3-O-[3-hydroxymyristoyl] glucosamine N-acyltransferase
MMETFTNEQRLEYAKKTVWAYPENHIHKSASIHPTAVIGKAGFGYARDVDGTLVQIPHRGNVVIGAHVDIGAQTCIDRAVKGSTIVSDGSKIDNLCHLGHGCFIGNDTLIVAGSVIGGSAVIGERCFIGMGALIKNKITIGNDVTIGAGAVVLKDVPDGETWVGNPARKLEK